MARCEECGKDAGFMLSLCPDCAPPVDAPRSRVTVEAARPAVDAPPAASVRLAGVDIPFADLVVFFVKAMFATIPAAALAGLIYWVIRAAVTSHP